MKVEVSHRTPFLISVLLVVSTHGFIPNGWRNAGSSALGLFLIDTSITHKAMTRDAIAIVAKQLLRSTGHLAQPISGTNPSKIFREAFGASASSNDFVRAIEAIATANANVDSYEKPVTEAHFDAEDILDGNERLLRLFRTAVGDIRAEKYDEARTSIGKLLHGLQDFYSHSNWIELGHASPNNDLGKKNRRPSNIAPPKFPTCVNCHSGISSYLRSCKNNLVVDPNNPDIITSGYYVGQNIPKPLHSSLDGGGTGGKGKCSHGGLGDTTAFKQANGGINKDATNGLFSPHNYLHKQAAAVATDATVNLLRDLWMEVGDDDFLSFLGLDYGASLSFAIDTTGSMSDDIQQVYDAVGRIVDSRSVQPSEFVLAPFNDPGFGPVYQTTDLDQFKSIVWSLISSVSGGGDAPEKAISGLILALQNSRPGSTVYLFTDASAKDYERYSEALALILAKRIKVFFIVTNPSSRWRRRRKRDAVSQSSVYSKLAEVSGGQVLSETKAQVGKILEITSTYTETSDVTLLAYESALPTNAAGYNVTAYVDNTIEHLTVSVSGENPTLTLIEPNGEIAVLNRSNFVQLLNTAISRVPSPASGRWTITVSSSDPYDLLVKGNSYLDFLYSVVVPKFDGHPGMYPILGRPRIGDSVFIQISVVGISANGQGQVDKVILLSENGAVLSEHLTGLLSTDDSSVDYTTASSVVVPTVPFRISIIGKYRDQAFARVAHTPVTPLEFKVTLTPQSELTVKQGKVSVLEFLVAASPELDDRGIGQFFTFSVEDSMNFASTPSPSLFYLSANESQNVEVKFSVPLCFPNNAIDSVTITVKSEQTNEVSSFLVDVFVDSEFIDESPPTCFVNSASSITCSSLSFDCVSAATWKASFIVLDTGAGLQEIKAIGTGAVVQLNQNLDSYPTAFIEAIVTVPCCNDSIVLLATDKAGNQAACSADKQPFLPDCSLAVCYNGGRCKGENKCQCLGGYYGNDCSQVGCPKPVAPEYGKLKTNTSSFAQQETANFSCNTGYELTGENGLTCCSFGWAGSIPECVQSVFASGADSWPCNVLLVLALLMAASFVD